MSFLFHFRNLWRHFSVAYFNGAHDKLAETLKLLERYQEENRDEIEKPSILETAETNGKILSFFSLHHVWRNPRTENAESKNGLSSSKLRRAYY